ncbi:MAG: hypothetical protein AB7O26_15785 [Planctomycetaceae bacterium]
MENHRANYHERIVMSRDAEREARYGEAVHLAKSAWKYIDGMMRYERKYLQQEFDSIDAIDIVLQYAPVVFDHESLFELDAFLKKNERIAKQVALDLDAELRAAHRLMGQAVKLWSRLEVDGKIEGNHPAELSPIAEAWREMGVVRKLTDHGLDNLEFVTLLNTPARGKCPRCAAVVQATKSKLLEELRCPGCREMVEFVLIDPLTPCENQEQ